VNRKQWLTAWRTYRESGWLRSVSLDGKDTARLCSEVNIQRHNYPYPYASLRDRLQYYRLMHRFDPALSAVPATP